MLFMDFFHGAIPGIPYEVLFGRVVWVVWVVLVGLFCSNGYEICSDLMDEPSACVCNCYMTIV